MSDEIKVRKTRLKGTAELRPCVDCGQMKDRLKDFKPRWAGCPQHRTEKGRRFYQDGCEDCKKIVNGNIRQPRCIVCDKARPKKPAAKKALEAATAAQNIEVVVPAVVAEAAPVVEVAAATVEVAPAPVTVDATPTVEPVVAVEEPKVVGLDKPSEASVEVTAEPVVAPAPVKAAPVITSLADLSKLFDAVPEEDQGE